MNPSSMMLRLIIVGAVALPVWLEMPALAEVRTIATTGEYRMGDNDTRIDAKRLALLDAKRLALEQAGSYIESITEVKSLDLAKEEIRAYTAGIVEVIEQASRTMMEGETTLVRVDVKAKIDTDVVARQIEALRKNEDVRDKLLRAEAEALKLRKQLDDKTHELSAANSLSIAEAVSKQRQRLMTQADVENLIARARVVLAGSKGFTVMVGTSTPESRKYARSLIDQALSYDPDNSEAQSLLGFVQFEDGQREEAITTFRTIAKREPLSAHAHKNLGTMLQTSGDWFSAAKEYETATKLDPNYSEAYAALGYARIDASRWLFLQREETSDKSRKAKDVSLKIRERAVEAFREATRLDPRNSSYHRALGETLCSLARIRYSITEKDFDQQVMIASRRDREEGLAELRRAVELDPRDASVHRALAGEIEFGEEAIAEYRAAIRLSPGDVDSRIELGKLLLVRTEKDPTGALELFDSAVRIDPQNAKAHMQLGVAFEHEFNEMGKAIEEYRKAVDLGPDAEPAIFVRVSNLSRALAKVGQRKESAKVIRDYLESEPEYEAVFHERLLELERE